MIRLIAFKDLKILLFIITSEKAFFPRTVELCVSVCIPPETDGQKSDLSTCVRFFSAFFDINSDENFNGFSERLDRTTQEEQPVQRICRAKA